MATRSKPKKKASAKHTTPKKGVKTKGTVARPKDVDETLAFAQQEFRAGTSKQLTKDGEDEFKNICELTIGYFVKKGPDHLKKFREDGKFRNFLSGEIKKIAAEADAQSAGATIDGTTLHTAAVKMMKQANKFCRVSVDEKGTPKVRAQGEVCATYLATQGSA